MTRRLAMIPLLGLFGCLLAGAYGVLHNQVSYTVSPEYFTKFKFEQFQIDPAYSDRVGAGMVGWEASWWMGIVIAVFLLPVGLLIRDDRVYATTMLRAFGVVVMTTIFSGFVGLAIAFLFVSEENVREISKYGNRISNDVAFLRAGTIHNFSYLGGMIGIVTGGTTIFRRFLNQHEVIGNDNEW